jgi:hypothetical protein
MNTRFKRLISIAVLTVASFSVSGCVANVPYRTPDGEWSGGDPKIRSLIEVAQIQARGFARELNNPVEMETVITVGTHDFAVGIEDQLGRPTDGALTLILSPASIKKDRFAVVATFALTGNGSEAVLSGRTRRYVWDRSERTWIHSPLQGAVRLILPE